MLISSRSVTDFTEPNIFIGQPLAAYGKISAPWRWVYWRFAPAAVTVVADPNDVAARFSLVSFGLP
jgi:hypothetical protein